MVLQIIADACPFRLAFGAVLESLDLIACCEDSIQIVDGGLGIMVHLDYLAGSLLGPLVTNKVLGCSSLNLMALRHPHLFLQNGELF